VKTDLYHMQKDMQKRQIAHAEQPTKETHATCKEITKRDRHIQQKRHVTHANRPPENKTHNGCMQNGQHTCTPDVPSCHVTSRSMVKPPIVISFVALEPGRKLGLGSTILRFDETYSWSNISQVSSLMNFRSKLSSELISENLYFTVGILVGKFAREMCQIVVLQ